MSNPQSGQSFLRRLKADSSLAAFELDEKYRSRLCRLVEQKMNERFRRKEDPEDVVQSAFRTFYRRKSLGEFSIDSASDLWRLLETITVHKLLKHVEKLNAKKRNAGCEEYLNGDILQGREPSPDEASKAADLIEKVLEGLDESYVKVFHRRLQKYTEDEIAAELGCTRAFVRAKLKRIRDRLEKLLADGFP
jgi:RNA polymerase sigma-70 factor (ECF subfamily)